jgi:hypothetical protein
LSAVQILCTLPRQTPPEEDIIMLPSQVEVQPQPLQRGLCILVVAIMVIAVLYAAWIAIGNFSRIGV